MTELPKINTVTIRRHNKDGTSTVSTHAFPKKQSTRPKPRPPVKFGAKAPDNAAGTGTQNASASGANGGPKNGTYQMQGGDDALRQKREMAKTFLRNKAAREQKQDQTHHHTGKRVITLEDLSKLHLHRPPETEAEWNALSWALFGQGLAHGPAGRDAGIELKALEDFWNRPVGDLLTMTEDEWDAAMDAMGLTNRSNTPVDIGAQLLQTAAAYDDAVQAAHDRGSTATPTSTPVPASVPSHDVGLGRGGSRKTSLSLGSDGKQGLPSTPDGSAQSENSDSMRATDSNAPAIPSNELRQPAAAAAGTNPNDLGRPAEMDRLKTVPSQEEVEYGKPSSTVPVHRDSETGTHSSNQPTDSNSRQQTASTNDASSSDLVFDSGDATPADNIYPAPNYDDLMRELVYPRPKIVSQSGTYPHKWDDSVDRGSLEIEYDYLDPNIGAFTFHETSKSSHNNKPVVKPGANSQGLDRLSDQKQNSPNDVSGKKSGIARPSK